MPRPLRYKFPGAKYHAILRGNGRQTIFRNEADCERFRDQLAHALDADEVILYAWACMPNHAHLLIDTPLANIDRFMQRLGTAYSMYYRHKYKRPGHCLQGRYKAKLASGDLYLLRLTRYIHLNPVGLQRMEDWTAEKKINWLRSYRWSSYRGYIDRRHTDYFVDYHWLSLMERRSMDVRRKAYRDYVERFIGGEDNLLAETMSASNWAIGDDDFRQAVEREIRARSSTLPHPEDVAVSRETRADISLIAETVAEEFGIAAESLYTRQRIGEPKAVFIELVCRFGGVTQRDLATRVDGASEHAIGKQRKRLQGRLSADAALAQRFERTASHVRGLMSNV